MTQAFAHADEHRYANRHTYYSAELPSQYIAHQMCGCLGLPGNNIEVHFVIVNAVADISDYGSVIYPIVLPDGTAWTRSAEFRKRTGGVVHYKDRLIARRHLAGRRARRLPLMLPQ